MRMGTGTDVYEVFGRMGQDPGQPIAWLGSVRGKDPILAWHYAKEIYTRREDCTVLWVVPRAAMVMSDYRDAEVLRSPRRLDYRTPAFPSRHRRDRAKAAEVAVPEGVES